MLERIDFIKRNEKITVYRCYGTGSALELPGEIEGFPVTELADHCFAAEPSCRYDKRELCTAYRDAQGQWKLKSKTPKPEASPCAKEALSLLTNEPLAGDILTEICLPVTMTAIGDYAFYGCQKLERLYLPEGLQRLGGGAFVACNRIKQIYFSVADPDKTPCCMKEIVGEITYELEVLLQDSEGKNCLGLVFPEYYEESKENTPARIIEIIYHGTGYKYRQCFKNRQLDLQQYDSLFYLAAVQEFVPTVMKLALYRLQMPCHLTSEKEEEYLTWVKKEYRALADWIFREKRTDILYLLEKYHYYTEEILEYFLKTASASGEAEAVSALMDYCRIYFKPTEKKKYEF